MSGLDILFRILFPFAVIIQLYISFKYGSLSHQRYFAMMIFSPIMISTAVIFVKRPALLSKYAKPFGPISQDEKLKKEKKIFFLLRLIGAAIFIDYFFIFFKL